ncbi:hypothetical protein BLNAU_3145 [Blattamonas nauphoetae]|uniref:Uncharacterized protein n=1 Tax=Blattamonas nauphoetae TaxID=2049346 RepID=A0ABQ9YD71_9EUKA|nr:hypothetical protein BLNAU_3145 [Blattamonas nauphoetae]
MPKPLAITSRTHQGEMSVLSSGQIVQSHAGTTTLDTILFSLPATSTRTELFLVTSGKLNVKSCSLSSVSGTIPFGVLNVTGGTVELLSLTPSAQTVSTLPHKHTIKRIDEDCRSDAIITNHNQEFGILENNSNPTADPLDAESICSNLFVVIWSTLVRNMHSHYHLHPTRWTDKWRDCCDWSDRHTGTMHIPAEWKDPNRRRLPVASKEHRMQWGGSVIVSSAAGGDGVDPDSHFWISEHDCTVTLPNPQSNTPYAAPTLSDAVYSANDTHLTAALTGTLLFPCGLKFERTQFESKMEKNSLFPSRPSTPPPADPTPDPPPTDPTDPPSPPVDPVDPKDPAEGGLKFPMWLIGMIVGALVAAVAVVVVVIVVRRNSQPKHSVYLYIELDEENSHQPGRFETATMNCVKLECTLALEALKSQLIDQ